MKKLLIALSTLFIVACSDGDIGGYTESIIKGARAPESNASLEQQPSLLKKSSSPLDEDLSGLDEEELREKLMNSYPWPKPEGVAEPSSSSESGGSSSTSITIENTFDLPHNPYDGRIITFDWKKIAPSFEDMSDDISKHKYGFDQDPTGRDPIVYISTLIGEDVKITPYLTKVTFDTYYLLKEGEPIANLNTSGIVHQSINIKSSSSSAVNSSSSALQNNQQATLGSDKAKYTLYGCLDKPQRRQPTCYNLQKQIEVIPYSKVTKHIIYVESNGDNPKLQPKGCDNELTKECEEECKKGFSEICVKRFFNDVFRQAVMDVEITPEPIEDYDINGYINIWLTNTKRTIIDSYTKIENKARLKLEASDAVKKETSGDKFIANKTDDPHWHVVFAINNTRKIWELGQCKSPTYDLSSCNKFDPEEDPKDTEYYLGKRIKTGSKREDVALAVDEHGEIIKELVTIEVNQTKDKDMNGKDIYNPHYYIIKDNKKYAYAEDDVLFTENGYPIVPAIESIDGNMNAYNSPFNQKFDDYMPYGSIIFSPKRPGLSSYYLLMHEIGHTFGLTDVSLTDFFGYWQTDKTSANSFFNNKGEKGQRRYANYFASSETNLMAWQAPSGKKLRYRPTQIACTLGGTYYKVLKSNGKFDKTAGTFGILEARIPDGFEPNQWDCLRKGCLDSKNYSIQSRKDYFENPNDINSKGACIDNDGPTKQNDKNHFVTSDEFKQREQELYYSQILNLNKSN